MKVTFMAVRLKVILIVCVILFFIAGIVKNPFGAIDAAKTGLELCAGILVPSLFPFLVFSGLLISSGFAGVLSRALRHIMPAMFGVSGSGALAFVLGIISGYPLGASCVCDLYQNGYTAKAESERLLAFCNNSGPLFIIGSVGAAMYQSQKIGILLYIVHILAAVTVGFLFRYYKRGGTYIKTNGLVATPLPYRTFGEAFSTVMRNSINNMLLICGFAVIFSVIINFLPLPPAAGNGVLGGLLAGVLEITTGLYRTSALAAPIAQKLVVSAAVLGFAGFSVHFQVMGIVSKTDLSLKAYILGKAAQAVISAIYMWIALRFTGPAVPASAPLSGMITSQMPDVKTIINLSFAYAFLGLGTVMSICLGSLIYRMVKRSKCKKRAKFI